MGQITNLKGENLTLTTAVRVLAALQSAAAGNRGAKIEVLRLEIFQVGTTTLQQIRGEMATRDTAGTLTCTSQAPLGLRPLGGSSGISGNTAPAGGTGRSGINGSVDSDGTYTQYYPFGFANLNGYLWKPEDQERIIVPASTLFVIRLLADPTTLTGWGFNLVLDEE